jgi:hypothetical protein
MHGNALERGHFAIKGYLGYTHGPLILRMHFLKGLN